MHQFFEQLQRDFEALLRIRQGQENSVVAGLPGKTSLRLLQPLLKFLRALTHRKRGIVANVIGVAHEGIHRAQRIPFLLRQGQKGVIEILRGRASYGPARGIGVAQLRLFGASGIHG